MVLIFVTLLALLPDISIRIIQCIFYPGIVESIAKEEELIKIELKKLDNVISMVDTKKTYNNIKDTEINFNQEIKYESIIY